MSYSSIRHGDNLSDHSTVFLSLKLDVCYRSAVTHAQHGISWPKATAQNIADYKNSLQRKLSTTPIPREVLSCDVDCSSEVHAAMIRTYHNAITDAMADAAKLCIPRKKKRRRAGWNTYVKPLQEEAKFWQKIWTDCGKPSTGWVSEIRRKTRGQYKRMAQWVVRNQDKLSAERMADALRGNHSRDLWAEVKRRRGHSSPMPNVVDDIDGEEDVCNLFKEKYEALYSSVAYDVGEMNQLKQRVTSDINTVCAHEQCYSNHSIDVNDVLEAVHKLKSRKSDVNVDLCSDGFKNACNDLFVHLALILRAMYTHCGAPVELLTSMLVPIPKDRKKTLSDSSNYRSIAISSIIGKIFDNIILSKHANVLQSSDLQFGFKPKHSTVQCTFVLNEVVEYYNTRHSPVFVTLLDASRAFDRVQYIKLFTLLLDRGMCPTLVKCLIIMYTHQSLYVRWQGSLSDPFACSNGIKQGGVLSPVLFCIYMDELIKRLSSNSRFGCYVGHKYAGCLTYADDVTLLAPTYKGLMEMLKTCEQFSEEFDVLYNSQKSHVILFDPHRRVHTRPVVTLNSNVINYIDSALHLGNFIGRNAHKLNTQKIIHELYIRTNTLLSHYSHCSSDTLRHIFVSYCTSFYGSSLWNLNNIEQLCIAYRKCVRKLFNLPYRTHSVLIQYILQQPDLPHILLQRFCSFITDCYLSSNRLLNLCAQLSLYTNQNVNLLSNSLSISSDLFTELLSNRGLKIQFSELFLFNDELAVQASVLKELSDAKKGILETILDHDEICMLIELIAI